MSANIERFCPKCHQDLWECRCPVIRRRPESLLVEAAPDLLRACKMVVTWWTMTRGPDEMPLDVFDALTNSIAMAEGRS